MRILSNNNLSHYYWLVSRHALTSSVFRHLEELGVDGLVGLAEDRDQVVGLPHIVGRKERVGRARLLTAGRSADAVDVVLGRVRVVIIDDKFHILHIWKVLQCGKKECRGMHRILHTTTARPKTQVSKDHERLKMGDKTGRYRNKADLKRRAKEERRG